MSKLLAGVLLAPMVLGAGRDLVVFDTDSGTFGDDGAALVMLLRSPTQVSLQGITVVSGNLWASQGAECMAHILDVLKRPLVPIYVGSEFPFLHTPEMATESERRWGAVTYSGAFAMPHPPAGAAKSSTHKLRHDAVAYLISEIERHPGEVTVL